MQARARTAVRTTTARAVNAFAVSITLAITSAITIAIAIALAVLTLTLGNAHAAVGSDVDEIDALIDAGAGALALRIIEREQPPLAQSAPGWQRFERRRLDILASRNDWPALIERVGGYPPAVPDDFWSHAQEMRARAYLASGDARAATAVLAELIWGPAQDTAMADERRVRLKRWRGMLAESYLLAGQNSDAQTAALRYSLDYADEPLDWRMLHARALVRSHDDAGARELLQGLDSTEAAYLRLLMRAREAGADPVEVLSEMRPWLGEGRLTRAERAQLWASLAAAAAAYRDPIVRVTAMEQAVVLAAPVAARDRFVRVDADDLWDAYEALAAALANEERLLVGRFDAWLALARRFDGAGDARARALYAYLAAQKRDAGVAGAARTHLAEALATQSRGLEILAALYLDSDRYPNVDDVPRELRAPLAAHAIAHARTDLAARLIAGMDAQERGALALRWRVPVAVTLIDTDRVEAALALFAEDGQSHDARSEEWADALATLALALQMAGEYEHSAALATRALPHAQNPQRRRALLMLGADSAARAGQHERAARLYIAAARVPGEGAADGHARSARLDAARVLARAGLHADALAVLDGLQAHDAHVDRDDFLGQMLRSY